MENGFSTNNSKDDCGNGNDADTRHAAIAAVASLVLVVTARQKTSFLTSVAQAISACSAPSSPSSAANIHSRAYDFPEVHCRVS
ncbi:MAG: hypothetical protein ACLT98_04780 [Eggerthellaceae bacterium]